MALFSHLRSRSNALWLGLALGLAACATPPAAVTPPITPAHLLVENTTSFAWCIALTAVRDGAPRAVLVAPHASVAVELAGGEYQVEQARQIAPGEPEPPRRFPLCVEAGRTYRWALAMLMAEADDADPDATDRGDRR